MYEINAENLKLAYKKLKHYIYYYRTSSCLKDKIIDFEENYKNWVEFENELNVFNRLLDSEKELKDHYDKYHKLDDKSLSAGSNLEIREKMALIRKGVERIG